MKMNVKVEKLREVTNDVVDKELTVSYEVVLTNKDKTTRVTIKQDRNFEGLYKGQELTVTIRTTQKTVKDFTKKKKGRKQ